jgi:gas vesicle protein
MTNNPDEIRSNIELTRQDLGSDVDALADKVTPSKIAQRQTRRVRSAFNTAKERVMGAASDVKDASAESVSDVQQAVTAKAQGNPLAVGLIAFGAGWLAASLVPASSKEKEIAASVKDAAQPLVEEVAGAAREVADNLRQPAQEAAEAVKASATDSARTVKDEATSAAAAVSDQASEAKHAIEDDGS